MAGFQGQLNINIVVLPVGGQWHMLAQYNFYGPGSYSWTVNNIQVGDTVILQSSSPLAQTHRFTVTQIDGTGGGSPNEIDFWVEYNDTGTEPTGIGAHTAMITAIYNNNFIAVPSSVWCRVDEFLIEYVNSKNAEMIEEDGNKDIQGYSGFASHYVDGLGSNDVNSYIEYNPTDGVHYHRIEPKVDANYLDIRIGFQFPSTFTGLVDTGNAFEFNGKADNGSGDGVNVLTLTKLVGTDGTEYPVAGKSINSGSRTLMTLTKAEVDAILNPVTSSSSSSNIEWDETDSGKIVFAEFRLFGNDGDNIYLDNDKDFMFIL